MSQFKYEIKYVYACGHMSEIMHSFPGWTCIGQEYRRNIEPTNSARGRTRRTRRPRPARSIYHSPAPSPAALQAPTLHPSSLRSPASIPLPPSPARLLDSRLNPSHEIQGHEAQDSILPRKSNLKQGEDGNPPVPKNVKFEEPETEKKEEL